MEKNTSVSLVDSFENGRISEVKYKNAIEVICAGLRLLKEVTSYE